MPTIRTTLEPWREIVVSEDEYLYLLRDGLIFTDQDPPPAPPSFTDEQYDELDDPESEAASRIVDAILAEGTGGIVTAATAAVLAEVGVDIDAAAAAAAAASTAASNAQATANGIAATAASALTAANAAVPNTTPGRTALAATAEMTTAFAAAGSAAYTIDYGTDLNTPRETSGGAPIGGRVIWQGVGGSPVNRLDGDLVFMTPTRPVPAWTPADLPGVLAWFDAQALTLADSAEVTSWTDSSGNAHPALAGEVGSWPLYRAAGVTGLPSVQFDGSNDYLQFTFPEYNGLPWTVYCVAASAPVTVTGDDAFFGGGNASLAARVVLERRSTDVLRGLSATTEIPSAAATADNSLHVYKLVQNGTSSSVSEDGAIVASGTLPTSSVATDRIRLGGRVAGTNFFDGHLCELVFVQGTVAPADDILAMAYLNEHWWLA